MLMLLLFFVSPDQYVGVIVNIFYMPINKLLLPLVFISTDQCDCYCWYLPINMLLLLLLFFFCWSICWCYCYCLYQPINTLMLLSAALLGWHFFPPVVLCPVPPLSPWSHCVLSMQLQLSRRYTLLSTLQYNWNNLHGSAYVTAAKMC